MPAAHGYSGLAAHLRDVLDDVGAAVCKRYFGGTGIWIDAVLVGAVLGGVFYLRVSPSEARSLAADGGRPFSYSTKRGRVTVGKFVSAPVDLMEDEAALSAFVGGLSVRQPPENQR
ncbi:MAG: TfoX/Sxy family protein [Alphaproteobacteria bacterium]